MRLELQRLKRFVENLLDLSRLQAGAAVPAQAIWTADALAEQALDELQEGSRVRVEVPDDLPPLWTDAAQVQRALVNVLENALKFSPAETMVVLRAESAGDDVILRVDDRGPASHMTRRRPSSSRSSTRAAVAAPDSGLRSPGDS